MGQGTGEEKQRMSTCIKSFKHQSIAFEPFLKTFKEADMQLTCSPRTQDCLSLCEMFPLSQLPVSPWGEQR